MRKVRCAIYTRKSSEDGLEQEFNSLHAQREACAAYIASQKHEGWVELPDHYDDGGISGGTLEREGLQRLMRNVEEGLVDQIVVYKIDRLTRSVADFARLVDRLDAAKASFVSVTQSFNTSTSMRRLTLNVLLSFAQFEREVTAERIRDKIAASKRKGLWMGGTVPLGYEPDGRTLKIVEEDAATVRTLYDLYRKHGSLPAVKREADRLGLRTKPGSVCRKRAMMEKSKTERAKQEAAARQSDFADRPESSTMPDAGQAPGSSGKDRLPFEISHIHYILANPLYAGRIRHKDKVHDGQHKAIIDLDVWEEVQRQLQDQSGRKRGSSATSTSFLNGKLFDETGDHLTQSHANKKGVRYRYFISNRLIRDKQRPGRPSLENAGWRLPAKALEDQLATSIATHLRQQLGHQSGRGLLNDPSAEEIARLHHTVGLLGADKRMATRSALLATIVRADITQGRIAIRLDRDLLANLIDVNADGIAETCLTFEAPFVWRKRGMETKLAIGAGSASELDMVLLGNIALAHRYHDALRSGQSLEVIAASYDTSTRRILQVLDHAFLAPGLIRAAMDGRQPLGLTSEWIQRTTLPLDWQDQHRLAATL